LFLTPRRGHGRGGRSSSSSTTTTTTTKAGSDSSSDDVTLRLLVACFHFCVNKRHDAIEKLRKAIAREQRVVQGDAFGSDGDGDDNKDSGMPFSEEEDDLAAALTLAMNYVEDDVPLSSDSLENKGMRRKASGEAILLLHSFGGEISSAVFAIHFSPVARSEGRRKRQLYLRC
jgi:hypothetical protein